MDSRRLKCNLWKDALGAFRLELLRISGTLGGLFNDLLIISIENLTMTDAESNDMKI